MRMVNGQPLETTITSGAHHRNVVNTLEYAIIDGQVGGRQADTSPSASRHDSAQSRAAVTETQVWMMLEYCDRGSLQVCLLCLLAFTKNYIEIEIERLLAWCLGR